MMIKKYFLTALIFSFATAAYSASALQTLADLALENNADIINARNDWQSAVISRKTQDGFYMPSLTAGGSTVFSDSETENSEDDLYSFDTNLAYTQPVISGTTASAAATYSFTNQQLKEKETLSKIPVLSFSLTQSLFPFWAQGKKNPVSMNLKQQEQFYYNQYLAQKKLTLQNLAQNYISFIISQKEEKIYENSIALVQQQIDAYYEMQKKGSTNLAKISELEHTKWSYTQNLLSVSISKTNYLQNLKNLCGNTLDDTLLLADSDDLLSSDFSSYIISVTDSIIDPVENTLLCKLKILQANEVLEKQNNAPQLSLTATTQNVYSASVDFSPLLESTGKQASKQRKLTYQNAQNNYNAYLEQKNFVNEQYQSIITAYKQQLESIEKLNTSGSQLRQDMKKQYESGAISKIDYNSFEYQYINNALSMDCIKLNIWLYTLLLELNSNNL